MRRLGIALAATFAVAAPPAAVAQDGALTAQSPAGTPVQLNVRTNAEGLRCLSIVVGQETPSRTAPCVAAPATSADDAKGVHVVYRASPEKLTIVHGTLSAGTARLQLRFGNGRLVEVEPQGASRAYLAVFRGRPGLASTRAVGGDGRDRAAADVDPRFMRVEPRRSALLLTTADERGARVRFEAFSTPLLRPGSLRRSPATCVSVGGTNEIPSSDIEPGYSAGSACTFDRSRIALKYSAGCAGARRLLLFGLGPSVVRRYVLVTATGRRIEARTRPLPRRLRRPGRRAFLVSGVDPGRLDRLEAFDRRGQRLATLSLAAIGSGCGSSSRS